jgi:hypothetical protein
LAKKEKMEFAAPAAGNLDRLQAGRVDATTGAERQRTGGGTSMQGRIAQGLAGAVDAVTRMGLPGQGYTAISQVEMSDIAAVDGLHRCTGRVHDD